MYTVYAVRTRLYRVSQVSILVFKKSSWMRLSHEIFLVELTYFMVYYTWTGQPTLWWWLAGWTNHQNSSLSVPVCKYTRELPQIREYWMIYRRQAFSRVRRPPPPCPSPVSKLDQRHTGRLRKRHNLLMGKGGEEGVGEEPNQESLGLCKSFNNLCRSSSHLRASFVVKQFNSEKNH